MFWKALFVPAPAQALRTGVGRRAQAGSWKQHLPQADRWLVPGAAARFHFCS